MQGEKDPLPQDSVPVEDKPWSWRKRLLVAVLLFLGYLLILTPLSRRTADWILARDEGTHAVENRAQKVPLEAHIMSKCPDARDCLLDLVGPTMALVSDKVDFTLSYIGEVDPIDDSVRCKHGPEECLGNIIELCAADVYPDPKIYLGFAMCLSADYEMIPQENLLRGCALEHGIDFEKLNECASRDDGAYGMGLLVASVTRSSLANVTYSCTVRLANKVRCIRDGGEWKECDRGSKVKDLVRDIEVLYNIAN